MLGNKLRIFHRCGFFGTNIHLKWRKNKESWRVTNLSSGKDKTSWDWFSKVLTHLEVNRDHQHQRELTGRMTDPAGDGILDSVCNTKRIVDNKSSTWIVGVRAALEHIRKKEAMRLSRKNPDKYAERNDVPGISLGTALGKRKNVLTIDSSNPIQFDRC